MSVAITEKNSGVSIMVGSLVIFYLAWTIKELWLIEYIYSFGEILSPLLEALVKSLVWIVPAGIYIRFYLQSNPISYLKMNVNVKKGLFWGIVLLELLTEGVEFVRGNRFSGAPAIRRCPRGFHAAGTYE